MFVEKPNRRKKRKGCERLVLLSSPREVKEGCREQEVLRGMLEMDNHRRLRRKDEAFKSSIDEARAAQLGDLLSARLSDHEDGQQEFRNRLPPKDICVLGDIRTSKWRSASGYKTKIEGHNSTARWQNAVAQHQGKFTHPLH